ncbi:MAG TPA: quinol:electron acceptor oxidoreductase subunit ActD [Anaerolineales bacterium]|nr:quinol:electron acceptor oxidoreductase subunit ActD [Anaerolineales bacterium]
MNDTKTLLALFGDIDPAADAVEALHGFGIEDGDINVISGIPVTEPMLGRPHQWTNVPRLALGGALAGFFIGLFLSVGTPLLYPIHVGGQPIVPIPPSIIVIFEMTMLGMLVTTFLGVFLDSQFPSYKPKEYVPEISDGKIAVLFSCTKENEKKLMDMMVKLGAESVVPAEAQSL